eukprot:3079296-Prymnesium_polylepis.1
MRPFGLQQQQQQRGMAARIARASNAPVLAHSAPFCGPDSLTRLHALSHARAPPYAARQAALTGGDELVRKRAYGVRPAALPVRPDPAPPRRVVRR